MVAADGEVHRGDVVLHRPEVGTGGGELAEEVVDGSRREGAVVVLGVVVVHAPQPRHVTTIDGPAVAVHELAQLKLVEHVLQRGVRRRRGVPAAHSDAVPYDPSPAISVRS